MESMNLEIPDLRYPIGQFSPPDTTVTQDQVDSWIDDLAALPADLRRTTSALTDDQLDTPYRPGGWLSGRSSTTCPTAT